MSSYIKPHLTIEQQTDLLATRGMTLERDSATRWLEMAGYYRLSGYWYPFRRAIPGGRADEFVAGTTLGQVVALYEFDRRLRLLMLEALERIEVAMRSRIGYTLGMRGAFAHLNAANLDARFSAPARSRRGSGRRDSRSRYEIWLSRLEEAQSRSRENFVTHFERRYDGTLPVWVATELLDFGGLSMLFSGLKRVDRNTIASGLGVIDSKGGNGAAVANWLHVLTYLRNVCAHHSRLWNANMAVQLAPTHLSGVPALQHLGTLTPGELARSYPVVCVVAYLLEQVDPTSSWRTRLAELLSKLPATGRSLFEMGMPDDWGIRLGPEESSNH